MKKTLLVILAMTAMATTAFAQDDTKMHIHLTDGTVQTYNVSNIDSISFEVAKPAKPAAAYEITLPTDFSTNRVWKVMADGKQVAEIAREYVRSWDATANKDAVNGLLTVIYPMGADGKADLSKGLATNGASIAWDIKGDSVASYTLGAGEFTTAYLVDGTITPKTDETDIASTTLEAYVLEDNRSATDNNTYNIVKIGAQYWMESNLKATTFLDGSTIPQYNTQQYMLWANNTGGACHVYGDDMTNNFPYFGYMYNGYAVVSKSGLAPEGWEVSSKEQWEAMKKYLRKSQSSKVKSTDQWTSTAGNNSTGLNVMPGGYYETNGGDAGDGTDVYFWTSNATTDVLFRTDVIYTVRIKNSIMTTGTHDYKFGHYVRCVRK